VITAAVHPAAQLHGLAGGIGAQVAASVAAHAENREVVFGDCPTSLAARWIRR
jgi:hypothetical protein